MRSLFALLVLLFVVLAPPLVGQDITYYVDTSVVGGAGDGSSWANAYSSLQTAENARDGDITGGTGNVIFLCRGAKADGKTTFAGWTTDATHRVVVMGDQATRHRGVYSETSYRIEAAGSSLIDIAGAFMTIDGIQLKSKAPSATGGVLEYSSGNNTNVIISNCIVVRASDNTTRQGGIYTNSIIGASLTLWNCLVYGTNVNGTDARGSALYTRIATTAYSSTFIGGNYAAGLGSQSLVAKNCYFGGGAVGDIVRDSTYTLTKVNCATSNEDGTATGANMTATSCLNSVAVADSSFVSVAGLNFGLPGTSPLAGKGVNTSGESAPLNFATDISGYPRVRWSIGAFEPTVAGGASMLTRWAALLHLFGLGYAR